MAYCQMIERIKSKPSVTMSSRLSWAVGGNLLIASGRPKSCMGTLPANPNGSPNYNSTSFYCGGMIASENKLVSRGDQGRLPWDNRLDLNLIYRPAMVKGLALTVNVFNVFDNQVAQNREERFNNRTAFTFNIWPYSQLHNTT